MYAYPIKFYILIPVLFYVHVLNSAEPIVRGMEHMFLPVQPQNNNQPNGQASVQSNGQQNAQSVRKPSFKFKEPGVTFSAIDLDLDSGSVEVEAREDLPPSVSYQKPDGFDNNCTFEDLRDDNSVQIRARKKSEGGGACQLTIKINTHPKTALHINMGSGKIDIKGLKKRFTLQGGSVNVNIQGPLRKFYADIGAGSITAKNLRARTRIRAGSADLNLHYDPLFIREKKRVIQMDMGSGTVNINLPDVPVDERLERTPFAVEFKNNAKKATPDMPHILIEGAIAAGKFFIASG